MSESVASLLKACGYDARKLSCLQPDSPQAFSIARALATAAVQDSEAHWWKQRARNYDERLAQEHLRLVHTFSGPDGLDRKAWKALPRKLELLASRVVDREDQLAFQQFRQDEVERSRVAAELLPQINILIRRAGREVSGALHLLQAPASPWGSKSAEYEAGGKESVPRKGSGMLRFKAASRDMLSDQRVVQSVESARKLRSMRSSFRGLLAQRSKLSSVCQRLLDACISADAPGSSELVPLVGASEMDGHLSLNGISLQVSTARALSSILPACSHLTVLSISRTLLPDEALAMLVPAAATLPLTTLELVSVDLQRRSWPVLVAALVRPTQLALLPDAATTAAASPSAPSTPYEASGQCHRPSTAPQPMSTLRGGRTASRAGEPTSGADIRQERTPKLPLQDPSGRCLGPNWWLSLASLSLSGNTLGDEGLQVLIPHIVQLQSLQHLSLRQVGLTDWSAPQLELLMVQTGKLRTLDLSNNQMGPVCAEAVAAALSYAGQLTSLSLGWNTFAGSLQHVAWSLLDLASRDDEGSCGKLEHLDLAGSNLTHQDQMALAALLRFGRRLPLKTLDLSYNDLVGVPGQCLLRQAVAPPSAGRQSRPSKGSAATSKVKVMLQGCTISHAQQGPAGPAQTVPPGSASPFKDLSGAAAPVGLDSIASPSGRTSLRYDDALSRQTSTRGASLGQSSDGVRMPIVHRAMSALSRSGSLSVAGTVAAAIAAAAAAQQHLSPGRATLASNRPEQDSSELELQGHGRQYGAKAETASEAAAAAALTMPFSLDLAKASSDRKIARLLVEHELHARSQRYMAWLGMQLDDTIYRCDGQELVPFDGLYQGWDSDAGLPEDGRLVLVVRPVREADCYWAQWLQEES